MLGGRLDEAPYSAEEIGRMAGGLVQIDMADDVPFLFRFWDYARLSIC
jgi:hypothetical protein